MKKLTKIQKVKQIESKRDSSKGEHSPYWDYIHTWRRNSDGRELPQANPDVLPEAESTTPSTPQLLMGEAITHLQGRQREVYLLTMREDKSLAEVGEILGISKGAADTYKRRAIKFISQYCSDAIKAGRV